MPWSNQSGGGGPWRPNPGPWGSGPQSPGPKPPDLEDLLRRSQDRLKRVLPGGGGNFFSSGRGLVFLGLLAVALWGLSGIYQVRSNEQGVVLRFGKYQRTEAPGLRYHLPYPIETVQTPAVLERRRVDVGIRVSDDGRRTTVGMRDVPQESLMLTGDENIVDVNFSVFWQIKDAPNYLFNVQNPESTIKAVAESAMREVIGRSELQPILTQGRQTIEAQVHDLIQRTLDDYKAGVQITQVQLQKVDPPQQVIDAFRDVQAARADQERLQNEAQSYANRIVPESRGDAARVLQAAQGYRERVIAESRGQASRFSQIYEEYRKAPDITRERMFLETMERVLAGTDKIILDQAAGGQGVVPYLPLNELDRTQPPASGANAPRAQQGANR